MYTDSIIGNQFSVKTSPYIPNQQSPEVIDRQEQLFSFYKAFLSTLINLRSPSLMINTVICNNIFNSGKTGRHDQFVHYGKRIADLSIGQLQYPWACADADRRNQLSPMQFDNKAAGCTDVNVSQKLWAVSQFIRTMQSSFGITPQIYFWKSQDSSVVAVTLWDEVNEIKFGFMPTENI